MMKTYDEKHQRSVNPSIEMSNYNSATQLDRMNPRPGAASSGMIRLPKQVEN
jgi:hypothetical protein